VAKPTAVAGDRYCDGLKFVALVALATSRLWPDEVFGGVVGEFLDHRVGYVVVVLQRRRLHEVRRRAHDGSTNATVEGQLGAANGVDDDAR